MRSGESEGGNSRLKRRERKKEKKKKKKNSLLLTGYNADTSSAISALERAFAIEGSGRGEKRGGGGGGKEKKEKRFVLFSTTNVT